MNFVRRNLIFIFAVTLLSFLPSVRTAEPTRERLLLLVQGPDGHAEGTHEYVAGMEILAKELQRDDLDVVTLRADEPWSDGPEQLARADGVVLYLAEGAKWMAADPRRLESFQRLAEQGKGLSCLHWAMGTREATYIDEFVRLFGGCHGGPDRKFQVVNTTLTPTGESAALGAIPFKIHDEFYYKLKFTPDKRLRPLWHAEIDGQQETVAWVWQRPDGGRSFGFSGGHFHENWQRDEYRQLARQAILWTVDGADSPN